MVVRAKYNIEMGQVDSKMQNKKQEIFLSGRHSELLQIHQKLDAQWGFGESGESQLLQMP